MDAAGLATALMVRFEIVADWPSPDEPPFRPTTQLVAAYAPAPANTMPRAMDTAFILEANFGVFIGPVGPLVVRSSASLGAARANALADDVSVTLQHALRELGQKSREFRVFFK